MTQLFLSAAMLLSLAAPPAMAAADGEKRGKDAAKCGRGFKYGNTYTARGLSLSRTRSPALDDAKAIALKDSVVVAESPEGLEAVARNAVIYLPGGAVSYTAAVEADAENNIEAQEAAYTHKGPTYGGTTANYVWLKRMDAEGKLVKAACFKLMCGEPAAGLNP